MPSLRAAAATIAALAAARGAFAQNGTACPNAQLSCHNSTAVSNLCCFNAPGGLLLQTQFWDTNPSTGPSDSWTIHGLWPDNCNGGYSENCDSSRDYTDITQLIQNAGDSSLLDYMNTYWISNDESNEKFWEHEWSTHGTCISTLDTSCFSNYKTGEEIPVFFQTVVNLFKTLPTYQWLSEAGITPSTSKTYSATAIENALSSKHGGQVQISCSSGVLNAAYYYYNVRGSVQSGTFVATDTTSSSTCSGQIKYPPKSN